MSAHWRATIEEQVSPARCALIDQMSKKEVRGLIDQMK